MADARVRRNNLEIPEPLLAPAEKGVALDVALHFEFGIERESSRGAKLIHLHGVVDHQLSGKQRINFLRIAAECAHGLAHGCQIDHSRHAREILQQDARRHK